MKPSIVLYGNCQVRALSTIFAADPAIGTAFEVAYVASYDEPASPIEAVPPAVVERAVVLFEQVSPQAFPLESHLSVGCRRITFPSLDLNVLWPLSCVNPYTAERSAALPCGQFPYGDSLIVDCVRRGMSVNDTLAFYERSSEAHLPRLDRLLRLDSARLAARDAKCSVRMSDFVLATFMQQNLFWSNNHPTDDALTQLAKRLLASAATLSEAFGCADVDAVAARKPHGDNLSLCKIPVHPAVARYFQLRTYPQPHEPAYSVRNAPATYAEYFRALTEAAVSMRDGGTKAAADLAGVDRN